MTFSTTQAPQNVSRHDCTPTEFCQNQMCLNQDTSPQVGHDSPQLNRKGHTMSVFTVKSKMIAALILAAASLSFTAGASAETYEIKVPLKSTPADYSNFRATPGLTGIARIAPFEASCTLHASKADAATGANLIAASQLTSGISVGGNSFGSSTATLPLRFETAPADPVADGWRCVLVVSGTNNRVGSFVLGSNLAFSVKDCLYGSFQPNDAGAHCQ